MSFSDEAFDVETRSLMTRAFDEAWKELMAMLAVEPIDAEAMRQQLVRRMTAAARDGERDPKRLKLIALGVL